MLRLVATLLPALAFAVSAGAVVVRALSPEPPGERMIVAGNEQSDLHAAAFDDAEYLELRGKVAIQAIPASGGGTALYLAVNADGHIVSIDLVTDEPEAI